MCAFCKTHHPNNRIHLILWVIAAIGLLVIFFSACGNPHPPTTAEKVEPTVDTHGLHAVRNSELRSIMHKLHSLKLAQTADEIAITGELQRDICEIATIADSLAADAQLIPLLLRDDAMTPEARRVMATMSARMRYEAEALSAAANRSDIDRVQLELGAMLATCTACHLEFRAPALALATIPSPPMNLDMCDRLGGAP